MIEIVRRGIGFAAVLALGALPTALSACHESRPTAGASDNAAAPGGLLPAAPRPDVGASASRADAGVSDASAPVVAAPVALPSEPPAAVSAVPESPLEAAVTANNAFATALFAQVRAQAADKNLLTSPISATLALTMAYAGATGRTRTEMAEALQFGAHEPAVMFEGQKALSQALLARGAQAFAVEAPKPRAMQAVAVQSDYALQVVNSIWGEASYRWQAPFQKILANDYGAGIHAENFRGHADATRLKINAWVSAHTNDKINGLLPPNSVDADTPLVLVNALHLKFPWEQPFEPSVTKADTFTLASGAQVSASFMHREGQFAYRDDGAAQIIALPLAGRQLSVIIALPHASVSLANYENSLSSGSAALTPPANSALVELSLPKVTFTSRTFSLASALQHLGMIEAFDVAHAHFDGMWSKSANEANLAIGDVFQKTMIAMKETGVEAAAATAVVMTTKSLRLGLAPVPIQMSVNRPYLVAIVDVTTGAILMLGQIDDPTDAGGG